MDRNSRDFLCLSARICSRNKEVELTIETYICLFVYVFCEFEIDVYLVDDIDDYQCSIPLKILSNVKYISLKKKESELSKLKIVLPAVQGGQKTLFISGLCAVLRWCIKDKLLKIPDHFSRALLGFRGGCLVACTESSMWTKFCELQLPDSVNEISSFKKRNIDVVKIPENLVLLEAHLKRPVRTHNILKRKLDIAKDIKSVNTKAQPPVVANDTSSFSSSKNIFTLCDSNNLPIDNSDLIENLSNLVITEKTKEFSLNHAYLEGIDLTLADLIVFPCVQFLLENLPPSVIPIITYTINWYERMVSSEQIRKAIEKCGILPLQRSFSNEDENKTSESQ